MPRPPYHHVLHPQVLRLPILLTAFFTLLPFALSSCRYNFVPLIPKPVEAQLPTRITQATLQRQEQKLVVQAQVQGQFQPGFLKVQWFNSSKEIGTDSVYLDSAQQKAMFELAAPEKGAYRAVLSFGGVVLRQVELYEVEP